MLSCEDRRRYCTLDISGFLRCVIDASAAAPLEEAGGTGKVVGELDGALDCWHSAVGCRSASGSVPKALSLFLPEFMLAMLVAETPELIAESVLPASGLLHNAYASLLAFTCELL